MLTKILSDNYAFSDVILTPAPRGFVAETYYIDTHRGRYFAKIVKHGWDSQIIQQSLPVLQALWNLGVKQITYPILTTDGQFSVRLDDKTLFLFNYIEGQWGLDYPFEPYVRLLAQIHQLSAHIQTPIAREEFQLPFKADLLMR